jgi:hypothetical protein
MIGLSSLFRLEEFSITNKNFKLKSIKEMKEELRLLRLSIPMSMKRERNVVS